MSEKSRFSTLGCLKSDTSRLNYFSISSQSRALNRKKVFWGECLEKEERMRLCACAKCEHERERERERESVCVRVAD